MRPLVWLRADLRAADHTALHHACRAATRGVLAAFLLAPAQWRAHDWGPPRVDTLLRTLRALSATLARLRIPLVIHHADTFDHAPDALLALAQRHACDALYFNDEYEIHEQRRDAAVQALFERHRLPVHRFTDQVILPPDDVRTGAGGFFTVYSPFKRAFIRRYTELGGVPVLPTPAPQPELAAEPSPVPDTLPGFEPTHDTSLWPAGEDAALARLTRFIDRSLTRYKADRDVPALDATSALSHHLAVGSISPRTCLHAALDANHHQLDAGDPGAVHWISELLWREFYRHVLVGYPRVCMHQPFRLETRRIRWRDSPDDLAAWQQGRTGVPIVDAAMRALAATGWMHNRLRMVVAMYLTKDLFLDWRQGERHFMRHLIDADLPSNNGGWQWSASTGTDAAPYFRIFNPVSQSTKFDPDAAFIRRWVPELADLDTDAIHQPWTLPALLRARLDYPEPIADHAQARDRVLRAFKGIAPAAG